MDGHPVFAGHFVTVPKKKQHRIVIQKLFRAINNRNNRLKGAVWVHVLLSLDPMNAE
jgi:hypothetical protein